MRQTCRQRHIEIGNGNSRASGEINPQPLQERTVQHEDIYLAGLLVSINRLALVRKQVIKIVEPQ